uniref:Uncharacterized protein n=1 Tax=Arundo donax TaxID=35708 RepID=A0A0A9C2S4_ARUDO
MLVFTFQPCACYAKEKSDLPNTLIMFTLLLLRLIWLCTTA